MICTWKVFRAPRQVTYWTAGSISSLPRFEAMLKEKGSALGLGWYLMNNVPCHRHDSPEEAEFRPVRDGKCTHCGVQLPEAVALRAAFRGVAREPFPECEYCQWCGGTGCCIDSDDCGEEDCDTCPHEEEVACSDCLGFGMVTR